MLQASLQLYRNAYTGLSRQVWWLSFIIFINRSGTMVIPFLTRYLVKRGFTLEQAGYIMAAFGCGSILGGFLGGKLTDRFGHFHVQVASLFLNGVLFLVLGQMQTFWQFTTCIFVLSSLGEAFRPANSAAVAAYSNDSNRTRSYSLNRLAVNVGWAIGPAVGGMLANINYALLFWADGITCILAAVLLYGIFAASQKGVSRPVHREERKAAASAWKDRPFLFGMLCIFLVGLCFFQTFSIFSVYYGEVLLLNDFLIGVLLALNGLIIALVEMILVYKLENRKPALFYMMAGSVLIGLSFLMLLPARGLGLALLSMVVMTLGEMLLFPFMNHFWVKRSHEHNRGQYAAVYTMSFSLAIVLAPTFATHIAAGAGFGALWWVNFFICTFAGLGYYFLKQRMPDHE